MRITLAAVGRLKRGPMADLYADYAGRSAWPVVLREVGVRRRLSGAELAIAEGEALLGCVPPGARIVALDERGRDLASHELAARLGSWRDQGVSDVAFLIGGADGLAPPVRERADLLLAFGRATWPHQLARVLLAEQLYRTQTILSGHPYHREG